MKTLIDRDLSDCAAGQLREQAIENIAERIKSGKDRVGIFELLESELNSEREKIVTEEIVTMLCNESGEREFMADKMVDGLIERYIIAHNELVGEEADQIEREREE